MPITTEHHSIIVIGAGLSGLYTTWQLQQQQQDVIILEARERTGGRILSPQLSDHVDNCVDMGPAWVWPNFQPRLQQLVSTLNIELFKQNTDGDMLYEQDAKTVERYNNQSSHEMSYRIVGGANKLTSTLQASLPDTAIHLNTQVNAIEEQTSTTGTILNISASKNKQPVSYSADKIILALPPRITQESIEFTPPLTDEISKLWQGIPTWMASHCKIVFIYEQPFWREQKLSGEVFSRHGPLTEIYDASPADEKSFALTSFVGLNAHQRTQVNAEQLMQMCMAQLHRLFGDASQQIKDVQIKDWSLDPHTATDVDLSSVPHHPQYPQTLPRSLWQEKILLAGTEVAREHGGYIEGALESADEVLGILSKA